MKLLAPLGLLALIGIILLIVIGKTELSKESGFRNVRVETQP